MSKSKLCLLVVLVVCSVLIIVLWPKEPSSTDNENADSFVSEESGLALDDQIKAEKEEIADTSLSTDITHDNHRDINYALVQPIQQSSDWKPQADRDVSEEISEKIKDIIGQSIAKLGYEKIDTLSVTRAIYIDNPGQTVDGPRSIQSVSKDSYVRPGWTRRELSMDGQGRLIEVASGSTMMQVQSDGSEGDPLVDAPDIMISQDTAWFEYVNHPLMLHNELNEYIYESVAIKTISAEEAEMIGNSQISGHQVAVLKTPRGQNQRGVTFHFETWIDMETGFVVRNKSFMNDTPMADKIGFIYEEIAEGIFYPVEYRQRVAGGAASIDYEVTSIEINKDINQDNAFIFSR